MIHCAVLLLSFLPAYTGNACTPESRMHKIIQQNLWASPESKLLQFRVPSEPFLYPYNTQIPSQVRTSKKMGHRSSRSTLPSNYIHLQDDNRSIDVSTIKGNISDDLKHSGQALAAWDFFVSTEDKSFGLGAANIGKRSKFQPNSTGHTREWMNF